MRILWITNQPVPIIAEDMGMSAGMGGGWMVELSRQLSQNNIFGMAFPVSMNYKYKEGHVSNIYYYALPMNKAIAKVDTKQIKYFEQLIKSFQPDIIHIWGTEYMHTFFAVSAVKNLGMLDRTVLDLQGLVSVYARHYYGYIEPNEIRIPTIKNIYFRDSLQRQRKNFILRGKYEIESIKMVKHVMGRTDWDYACAKQINPDVQYHLCNRTLRDSFYKRKWSLAECEKHSLFVTQSQYPLKGFHIAIEALSILVRKWPDAHLYTTGRDILKNDYKERIFDSRYECYIRKKIKMFHLENNITFLNRLNEKEICEQFCRTHVSVLPSSIENSPNSVGEAMYLGVPTVAADVGGVKNMLRHEEEGFVYQADAPYMLAYYISRIFENDELAEKFSQNSRAHAMETHNKEKNFAQQLSVYQTILQEAGV